MIFERLKALYKAGIVKDLTNYHQDANSSKRVAEFIFELK